MCVWCVHECVLYTLWEDNLHVCVCVHECVLYTLWEDNLHVCVVCA